MNFARTTRGPVVYTDGTKQTTAAAPGGAVNNGDTNIGSAADGLGAGDIIFETDLVERARIKADGTVTGLLSLGTLPADVVITTDGATCYARNSDGRLLATNADPGALLAAVMPAAASVGGEIVFGPGNFTPQSTPGIPAGVTRRLRIRGCATTLITLSALGKRFLDFARVNDYDTFQHVDVEDFTIDATASGVTVNQHVILGNRQNTGAPTFSDQRVSFSDVNVRRVHAVGLPTAVTCFAYGFSTRHLAGGEATQTTIKDVLFEDCHVDGGVVGWHIIGGVSGGFNNVTNLNTLIDRFEIVRCRQTQSSGQVAGVIGTGGNVQVGNISPCGHITIRDFFGELAGDVGIEVDNAQTLDAEDCHIANAHNAFLTVNFALPPKPNAQSYAWRRCKASVTSALVAGPVYGFTIHQQNNLNFGHVLYEGCTYHQDNNVGVAGAASFYPFSCNDPLTVQSFTMRDCKFNVENINWNNAAGTTMYGIFLQGCTVNAVRIENMYLRVNGQISGAGLIAWDGIQLRGAIVKKLRVDGWDVDYNVTGYGGAKFQVNIVNLGTAAGTMVGGSIRGFRVINLGDDTGARGILVQSTANLTITSAPLTIEDNDFTAVTAGREINVDATQAALGAVLTRSNRWHTKPAPVALNGLATSAGKVLGAAGAAVIWRCLVQLGQGSGASITNFNYSTDGGTNYTVLLAQAAAALPAGAGPVVGPLTPADLVKCSFGAGAQPTITLVPVDP